MIRKGLRPGFRLSVGGHDSRVPYPNLWRFRRSLMAIAALVVMDIIFLVPAMLTFNQAVSQWGQLDSLFNLVIALFLSAWLLGWSTAPLLITAILILMLLGRETLKIGPGVVELTVGLPVFGLVAIYDVSKMRNLRLEDPPRISGSSWRGKHFAFDYGANAVSFGSDVNEDQLAEIRNSIQMISGMSVRQGDATAAEIDGAWEPDSEDIPLVSQEGTVVDAAPLSLGSPSTLILIIANLVPVAGTLFLGWNLSDVLVLYWAESAIIGLFNIFKIIVIGRWGSLIAVPFFVGHFGGFMAVHFLFVYIFFVKGVNGMNDGGGELADVATLFIGLWPALAALFASHAYSFFSNFVSRREFSRLTVKDQMSEPYSRIIFMQFVLIIGGALSMMLGQAEPVLIAIIVLKIYFDVKAHIREHAPGR